MSSLNGWFWIIAGVAIGAIEMFIPGYVFLGSAIALVIVGAAVLMGVTAPLAWLLIATGVLSLICWFLLRRTMGVQKGQVKIWHRDINDN
ncbi:MAG: hypothetical protein Q4G36_02950 [Paracoccus sp. (in: a-proteobacteria)]|nr:hypothetical protein [Paracoccus sp. (in: a-proteobacteria)]